MQIMPTEKIQERGEENENSTKKQTLKEEQTIIEAPYPERLKEEKITPEISPPNYMNVVDSQLLRELEKINKEIPLL